MPVLITQKKWRILPPDYERQEALRRSLGIHPVIAQLLINRGIKDSSLAADFLNAGLDRLHDPFLLKDMEKAVNRLKSAQRDGETVLIFGDYDVDGITASVVLQQVLTSFGLRVVNHIPDRMDDGYGLNDRAADIARQCGAALVISVDCGITALRPAAILKENQIDLIVIDHHEPSSAGLPDAVAVIDPKRGDCPYPFKHLAAVGLAAKFVQAVTGEMPQGVLDLVALGTIADVVPLIGENRIFVTHGLPRIEQTRNKGLRALLEAARIQGKVIKPYHAGFIIGPRINACGRMESARMALDLFLSDDAGQAALLAQELEAVNLKRQQLQRRIIQEAMDMVARDVDLQTQRVIVLAREGWHKGVLGIVASRVAETFYRPAVIAAIEGGWGTGSARSIDGFHLHEALTHCGDILEEFGGHKLAAGLTVHQDNIECFRKKINTYAFENLDADALIPAMTVDCDLALSDLTLDLAHGIDALEPYGEGNRPPIFCSRSLVIKNRPVVLAKETLKFWVSDGVRTFSAVGFGMGRYCSSLESGQRVDLAYELGIDDWNKAPVVQLKLKDIRI